MKKILALILALSMLLCGCSGAAAQKPAQQPKETEEVVAQQMESVEAVATEAAATEAATEPTTEPTTAPTEPPKVYYNPLNGEILDAPFDGRIYMNPVSNTNDASIPHVGAHKADILMEMFVNGSIIRLLALFSDPSDVQAIGSTRSTRLMFNDICQHYNAILTHAGGDSRVLADARERGITNYNIDGIMSWAGDLAKGVAYRDKDHPKQKYGEYNLYGIGPGIMAYVESEGVQISGMPETDYGLVFAEDGTPADGEPADQINITLVYGKSRKDTTMVYDAATGKYVFHQYGKEMRDLLTDEQEAFENVIVMTTEISMNGPFHTADFLAGGVGYYACNGQISPIYWTCDAEDAPFRFYTKDAQPLQMGMGKSYIAICSPDSVITWEQLEPAAVEETVAETTAATEPAA